MYRPRNKVGIPQGGRRENRDFEIRQLLRAYRSGLMSEAAFEEEMTKLEQGDGEPSQAQPGFEALGRVYRSEREAVINFLDELHATQMETAIGFAKWAAVCRTTGLRTGLLMIAEREAYHARVLERRVRELGGELHGSPTEQGSKLVELLANREISELEKLLALISFIRDPQESVAPIVQFASLLRSDLETRQALRLLAEDEVSSATWLHEICAVLSAQAPDNPAQQPEQHLESNPERKPELGPRG
jgi:hypothetical protein